MTTPKVGGLEQTRDRLRLRWSLRASRLRHQVAAHQGSEVAGPVASQERPCHDADAAQALAVAATQNVREEAARAVADGKHVRAVYAVVREQLRVERVEELEVGCELFLMGPALSALGL